MPSEPEGIDPLLTYFSNLALHLTYMPDNKTLPLPDATIPVEALTRIEVLLGIKSGMEFLGVFITHLIEIGQIGDNFAMHILESVGGIDELMDALQSREEQII
jgi:hypothetical protein